IEAWWHELMGTLRADAVKPESALGERIASVVQAAGQQLLADTSLRAWLNAQAQQMLLRLLDGSRNTIGGFVAERVPAWDAHDMSRTLENNIGRDLQFIRINGTLVGALVGLLLHAATEAVLALPRVQGGLFP
ncbi:MAG: DUF445 family protein, partial [Hydrogenophaga sp.]|nr:DUF445 family protein [Hydrogenophaga sp.]